jgi:TonB family protein
MAGQNSQLRVLWATVANFAVEAPRHCCDCSRPEAPPLKICKVVEPDYPQTALESGIRGTVVVEALVDKDGVPDRVRILRGDPTLAAAAFDAVSQWRWEPLQDLRSESLPIAIAVNFEPE